MFFPSKTKPNKKPSTNRFFREALVLGISALVAANSAWGLPLTVASAPPLTESRCVELALARPAVNNLIEGQLDAAHSDIIQAGQWPNPTFEYARESIDSGPDESTEEFFSISQRFDFSGRRALRREAAEQRLHATQAKAKVRQLDVVSETRRRFYELLHRQQRVEATIEWSQRLTELESVIRKRKAVGEASGYDLSRLVRERATAAAQARSEQAALDGAWERLHVLLGEVFADVAQTVTGELLPDKPLPVEQLLEYVENRPALRRLAMEAEAFTLEQKGAGRWQIPEVDLGVGLKTLDVNDRTDSGLLLNVAVALPLLDRRQAERSQARAQARISRGEYQLTLSETRGEVRALWKELGKLREAALDLQTEALVASTELIQIASAAYRGGEIGVLELLDAYRGALEAATQTLDLELKARKAAIELDSLTTRTIP